MTPSIDLPLAKFKSGDKVSYRFWFRKKHSQIIAPVEIGRMTNQWTYMLKDGRVRFEDELTHA